MGLRVSDMTFLDHSWDPLRVGSVCFYHFILTTTFKRVRRSVCNVLSSPPIQPSWAPFVTIYLHQHFLKGGICLFVTFSPHHQSSIRCVCLFVKFYPQSSPSIQPSWVLQARSETLRTPQNFILAWWSSLGLASRRPVLAY